MPRRSRPAVDWHQPRFQQISESHCGPAVVQMMFSSLGIEITQQQVAEAGGAADLIDLQGMRIDQLALAVRRLAPQLAFYVKQNASIADLAAVVQDYRHPAGVEWQGVFEDDAAARLDRANQNWSKSGKTLELLPVDSESGDSDYGHYSLVVRVDRRRRELIIADPYKDFYAQSRIFSFEVFDRRWYDYNEVPNTAGGSPNLVMDDHLMFIVTRRSALFPRRLGLTET